MECRREGIWSGGASGQGMRTCGTGGQDAHRPCTDVRCADACAAKELSVQEKLLERQERALYAWQAFAKRFLREPPAWYGGAFLEEGRLVILVKEGSVSGGETAERFSALEKGSFTIREAEYGYAELCRIQELVYGALCGPQENVEASGIAERFAACGVFARSNRVEVFVEGLTEADREAFRRYVCGSEAVILKEGKKPERCALVEPMDGLNVSGAKFTAGYAAAKTADSSCKGIVTCGHIDGLESGALIQKGAETVAEVRDLCWDQELDACFAVLRAGDKADNVIHTLSPEGAEQTVILTGCTVSYLEGALVRMYGGESGVRTGRVLCTSLDCGGLRGTVSCSYESAPGDSGAPVVILNSLTEEQTQGKLVGIHCGRAQADGEEFSYCVRADKINREFGLELL